MTNLDKVWNTWKSIEKVYESNAAKKKQTRLEFMKMMVGAPDSLVKLRELVNKDFDESNESVTKLNELFRVLERAQKRLETAEEIEDLLTFVWSNNWSAEKEEDYTVYSFNPAVKRDYASERSLITDGVFDSVFTLEDGKVISAIANPNSDKLLVFRDVYSILVWMGQMDTEVEQEDNKFIRQVYAVLSKAVNERSVSLPICFSAFKDYPVGCREFIQEDLIVQTLGGKQYQCKLNAWSYQAETPAGELQVVVFV